MNAVSDTGNHTRPVHLGSSVKGRVGDLVKKNKRGPLHIPIAITELRGLYVQTRFQKSWDTVQIVNKKVMQ